MATVVKDKPIGEPSAAVTSANAGFAALMGRKQIADQQHEIATRAADAEQIRTMSTVSLNKSQILSNELAQQAAKLKNFEDQAVSAQNIATRLEESKGRAAIAQAGVAGSKVKQTQAEATLQAWNEETKRREENNLNSIATGQIKRQIAETEAATAEAKYNISSSQWNQKTFQNRREFQDKSVKIDAFLKWQELILRMQQSKGSPEAIMRDALRGMTPEQRRNFVLIGEVMKNARGLMTQRTPATGTFDPATKVMTQTGAGEEPTQFGEKVGNFLSQILGSIGDGLQGIGGKTGDGAGSPKTNWTSFPEPGTTPSTTEKSLWESYPPPSKTPSTTVPPSGPGAQPDRASSPQGNIRVDMEWGEFEKTVLGNPENMATNKTYFVTHPDKGPIKIWKDIGGTPRVEALEGAE